MMRHNIIGTIFGLFLGLTIFFSCKNEVSPIVPDTPDVLSQLRERDMKKWAEERDLQKKQDESDAAWNKRVSEMYDAYYAALRAYKKSDHRIVYGWFGGWDANPDVPASSLVNLPDSVDVVSIWGGTPAFDENSPKALDLKYAQEVKGLRVLLCWQTGSSGLGLQGGVEAFNERHKGKNSTEKAIAYAQELTEFIKKHNLNGYDIDWEPNVGDHGGGCHNLYRNCDGPGSDTAPIRAFVKEMGKNFGPKQETDYDPRGTGTLFLFDGEVRDMANRFGDLGDYFDYFLNQNYYSSNPNHEFGSATVAKIKGWNWKKYVMCDEFEKDGEHGGVCGGQGGLTCAQYKATVIRDRNYGGWGAYHIELESKWNYRNVRSVTQIMNPSTGIHPDPNLIDDILKEK